MTVSEQNKPTVEYKSKGNELLISHTSSCSGSETTCPRDLHKYKICSSWTTGRYFWKEAGCDECHLFDSGWVIVSPLGKQNNTKVIVKIGDVYHLHDFVNKTELTCDSIAYTHYDQDEPFVRIWNTKDHVFLATQTKVYKGDSSPISHTSYVPEELHKYKATINGIVETGIFYNTELSFAEVLENYKNDLNRDHFKFASNEEATIHYGDHIYQVDSTTGLVSKAAMLISTEWNFLPIASQVDFTKAAAVVPIVIVPPMFRVTLMRNELPKLKPSPASFAELEPMAPMFERVLIATLLPVIDRRKAMLTAIAECLTILAVAVEEIEKVNDDQNEPNFDQATELCTKILATINKQKSAVTPSKSKLYERLKVLTNEFSNKYVSDRKERIEKQFVQVLTDLNETLKTPHKSFVYDTRNQEFNVEMAQLVYDTYKVHYSVIATRTDDGGVIVTDNGKI